MLIIIEASRSKEKMEKWKWRNRECDQKGKANLGEGLMFNPILTHFVFHRTLKNVRSNILDKYKPII